MVAQTDRRVLWHPRDEHKFAVGGGANITLYEWAPDSPVIRHVSAQDDLQHMKCFAWSPDAAFDDLIAVGLSNGKVELMRLEANRYSKDNGVLSRGPVETLSIRSSRACNAVAFCQANPNYLACGLDKVRGDSSLIVWDLETTLPKFVVSLSNTSTGLNSVALPNPPVHSPITRLPPSESRTSPRMLHHTASGEIVSTVAWMPQSAHLLLAGISGRFVRLHDFRAPSIPVTNLACRVGTLATDPHDIHRFACASDTGVISIWDNRLLKTALLSFSYADAAGDGARHRGNGAPTIEFSRTRRGLLATMEKDSTQLRLWETLHTPPDLGPRGAEPPRAISRESSVGRTPRISWTNPSSLVSQWTGASPSAVAPTQPAAHDTAPYHLVLSNTWKSKNFSRPITSFALVPSSNTNALTSNVMLVNKEGDLELYAMHDTPDHLAWSAGGDLSISTGLDYRILQAHPGQQELPPALSRVEPSGLLSQTLHAPTTSHTAGTGDLRRSSLAIPARPGHGTTAVFNSGRHGSYGESALAAHAALAENLDQITLNGRSLPQVAKPDTKRGHSRPEVSRRMIQHTIEDDISMVMRKRAEREYGLADPLSNALLTKAEPGEDNTLSELWKWLYDSKRLLASPTSKVQGFDFAYQGVLGIWEGLQRLPRPTPDLPPAPSPSAAPSATPSPVASYRNLLDVPNSASQAFGSTLSLPGLNAEAISSTRRRSKASSRRSYSPADSIYGDFYDAVQAILARRGIMLHRDREKNRAPWKPYVSTSKLAQRRLALELCGWGAGDLDLGEAIASWEHKGQTSRAACWSVFIGQYTKGVELLMRSEDETHFLLAGTLAGLTALAGNSSKRAELHDHCQRLVVRLQDPYLRALVTRLTTEDWADVLEETSLPLRERLAIALQFVDDSSLGSYLRRLQDEARTAGDISGLVVSGLTPVGLAIIRAWLDRTGDVQSAALIASYIVPIRIRDRAVDRWVEAYRGLLDRWRLFHDRCQFDIDRGEILQAAIREGDMEPFEWAPRQIVLRCNYCNKQLALPDGGGSYSGRPTVCMACEKPLPRCSVCLLSLNVVPDVARDGELATRISFHDTFDDALVMCQTCRHGGHATHIIEWFFEDNGTRAHKTCPVADCECPCVDDM